MSDRHGHVKSEDFGFVSFDDSESEEEAAVDETNDKEPNTEIFFAIGDEKKVKRQAEQKQNFGQIKVERKNRYKGVKLFVKNLDDTIDDEHLRKAFAPFGTIISAKVVVEDDRSKGYGFVSFEDPESANRACDEMNGRELNTKILYVVRARKKAERQAEYKQKFEQIKMDLTNRYQGVNLYVKNLDDTIDDERLRKEFAPFGIITSVKVMVEDGRSKGYGFVCFSSPEEATKALTEINGRIILSKKLNVSLAQRKEDREARLASQYMQLMAGMRMQQIGQMFSQGDAGYFVPTMPQVQRYFTPAQIAQVRASPRWSTKPQLRPEAQATAAFSPMQTAATPFTRMGTRSATATNQQATMRSSMNARPTTEQKPGRVTTKNKMNIIKNLTRVAPTSYVPVAQATRSNYKNTANMRNPPQSVPVQQPPVQQAVHIQGQEEKKRKTRKKKKPQN